MIYLLQLILTLTPGASEANIRTQIEAWIARHEIQTIEDLIAKLPREHREKAFHIHDSASLQSTLESPRILLFGQTPTLLTAFTGPNERSGNKLEFLEFDSQTTSWEPYEVSFFDQEVPKLEVRPRSCVSCHGIDTRPL